MPPSWSWNLECDALTHAAFDDATKRWTVEVERDARTITLQPAPIGAGTWHAGVPTAQCSKGRIGFRGIQHHSANKGRRALRRQTCVIVGANNPLMISRRPWKMVQPSR